MSLEEHYLKYLTSGNESDCFCNNLVPVIDIDPEKLII